MWESYGLTGTFPSAVNSRTTTVPTVKILHIRLVFGCGALIFIAFTLHKFCGNMVKEFRDRFCLSVPRCPCHGRLVLSRHHFSSYDSTPSSKSAPPLAVPDLVVGSYWVLEPPNRRTRIFSMGS
ncbi:hypothetical protein B0H12DRAFT_236147 [Mycena haematopus]|nr:hypothetical protein B0H12DRAFT_236147 [Mycena haematopus]